MKHHTLAGRQWLTVVPLLFSLAGCTTPCAQPPSATVANDRLADAVGFAGHRYKIFEGKVSWKDAKARCEALGGMLACIESEAEQRFIAKLANGRYLYLGGTDESEEGKFVWLSCAPFTYTSWMDGQPNNYGGNENYLATYDNGEWVDVAAEGDGFWMPTGFICEWSK
jgi:hypothetical protein